MKTLLWKVSGLISQWLFFLFPYQGFLKSHHENLTRFLEENSLLVCCCLITKSCPALCNPMDCRTPGLSVLHYLPEFVQIHVHWVGDAIQPSHPLLSPSPPIPKSLPASGSFPMSQLFTWGGQSIGGSALASVLPMYTQDWSSLEWTGWISLRSKALSRVFSNTTVQKHQFFGAQPSSQSNSHIHT